jgi:hypothetical protein
LAIVPFADRRGDEADGGDPFRVGGIYSNALNTLQVKLITASAWPPMLMTALAEEFRAAGIDARQAKEAPATGGAYWLAGDVHDFSTELRQTVAAHISATVRLMGPDGRLLVERRIEVRERSFMLYGPPRVEEVLNKAFAGFVRAVATNPEIQAGLRR